MTYSLPALLDAFPAPVLLLNAKRMVVEANNAARSIFGDHLIGHDLAHSLRHPAALEAATRILGGMADGGAHLTVEFALQVPVAQRFELHAMPVQENRLGEVRAVLVLLDVTAAHQVEQMRADFVANVSHELRSPLASLAGFIETLQGPAKDDAPARARFLNIMDGEARRMARLIDDLLSLSRVEAQEHIRPTGSVDLCRLLGQVREVMMLRAFDRGIHIELECPADLPKVAGDADQLMELFQNLLDNAVKYGLANHNVTVTVHQITRAPVLGTPCLRVAVHNDGEQIAPDQLPRLTERFYRVNKARSREIGGTGLGLAIVKHIVNRHRGRFTIESPAGSGTTCTVFLPIIENSVT